MNKDKNIFSNKIIFILGFFYLLSFMMSGKLSDLFVLNPNLIVEKAEFWRLFTYSMTSHSIGNLFLLAVAFLLFAPKLEQKLNLKIFPVILILMVFLQGTIHTLVFWKQPYNLSGIEGLSIFIISLYTFLYHKSKIKILKMPAFRLTSLVAMIFGTWIMIKTAEYFIWGSELIPVSFSHLGFGLIFGGFTYIQFKFLGSWHIKKKIIPSIPLDIPKPEELKYAMMAQSRSRKINTKLMDEYYNVEQNSDDENEERLNEILDKINTDGKAALLPEEVKFLEDYSNRI